MIKKSKKNVLIISRANINNSPVGIRAANLVSELSTLSNLDVINLTNETILYRKSVIISSIRKLLSRILIFPDSDVLLLKKYKKNISEFCLNKSYDIIIIKVLPFSFLKLVGYVKRISSKSSIFLDLSDPISFNMEFDSFPKLKRMYLLQLERKNFQLVDKLIVLNSEIRQLYLEKYPFLKIQVIEQGISKHYPIISKNSTKNGIYELIYAGNFYKGFREPYELYKAVKKFPIGKIRLNVYGTFNHAFLPPAYDCFYYGSRVAIDVLYRIYNEMDAIVFIDNNNSIQIPGKLLEVLSLNKPLIFIYYNKNSPSYKIAQKFEGVFFSENVSTNIFKCIQEVITAKSEYIRILEDYYWDTLDRKMLENY